MGDWIICNGDSTASLSVIDSGGVGSSSYSWSHGESTNMVDSLGAGTYIVSITDSLNCLVLDSVTLVDPDIVEFSLDSLMEPSCFGVDDGTILLNVSGGEGGFNFAWSNGDTLALSDSLLAGTYTLTVMDSLGCVRDSSVVLGQPDSLVVTELVSIDPLCYSDSNGIGEVTIVGGTAPYTITWNGNAGIEVDSMLASGSYLVEVTDTNGCYDSVTITVQEPTLLTLTLDSLTDVSCFGEADGQITVTASGGVGLYDYA